MGIIPWSLILPPVVIGTLGSVYFYPPAIFSKATHTTYCYPHVYTLNEEIPNARCFTVGGKEGRFISLSKETLKEDHHEGLAGGKIVEWMGGKEAVVIPGLWDGHGHLLALGEMLGSVKLYGAGSVQDVRERIHAHLSQNPNLGTKDNWIRGTGWDQTQLFPDEAVPHMPTSADLEASPTLKDKYIMLDRVDVHCVWVSSAVVKLLPQPLPDNIPGGEILGEGSVFCDNAMDMVLDVYPDKILGPAKVMERAEKAMAELNKVGIVGVHDAGIKKWEVETIEWMSDMGLLNVRINAMLECEVRNTFCGGNDKAQGSNSIKSLLGRTGNGMLSVYGVKIFADGALGSWGAALLEPYSDKPETSGTLLINSTTLRDVITQWYSAGYQVSTHCIGDLANHLTLEIYRDLLSAKSQSAGSISPNAHRRLRIEHAQIISPSDQDLMQSLGIILSIQPTHATSDSAYAESRLGKSRLQNSAYRMKSLYKRGLKPVLGSDFPVESHDPRTGIYAAVSRKNPYTNQEAGWHSEEAITIRQALEGFTKNPAYAMFAERDAGEIKEGMWADWVVVEYDGELGSKFWEEGWVEKGGDVRKLKVLETWVGGKKVYDAREEEVVEQENFLSRWGKGQNVMGWVQKVFGGSGL